MIGDRTTVSEAFLNELVSIGLSTQDLEELLVVKSEQSLRDKGVVDLVPATEVFEVFLHNVKRDTADRVSLSAASIQTYEPILRDFHQFSIRENGGEPDITQLMQLVVPYLTMCKERVPRLAHSTINKYTAVLRSFVHETANHYVFREPRLPKFVKSTQSLPKSLTDAEVKQLLNIASMSQYGLRTSFMISFFLQTGVRRDEFRKTRYGDIDMERGKVRVQGKGNRERVIDIPRNLLNLMETYFATYGIRLGKQYIYPNARNMTSRTGSSVLDETARRLFQKLPTYIKGDKQHGYHLHSLRHTYAVGLLRAGVPLRAIMDQLGHKSVRTTQIYTLLDTESLREVILPALDRMEQWWSA